MKVSAKRYKAMRKRLDSLNEMMTKSIAIRINGSMILDCPFYVLARVLSFKKSERMCITINGKNVTVWEDLQ